MAVNLFAVALFCMSAFGIFSSSFFLFVLYQLTCWLTTFSVCICISYFLFSYLHSLSTLQTKYFTCIQELNVEVEKMSVKITTKTCAFRKVGLAIPVAVWSAQALSFSGWPSLLWNSSGPIRANCASIVKSCRKFMFEFLVFLIAMILESIPEFHFSHSIHWKQNIHMKIWRTSIISYPFDGSWAKTNGQLCVLLFHILFILFSSYIKRVRHFPYLY